MRRTIGRDGQSEGGSGRGLDTNKPHARTALIADKPKKKGNGAGGSSGGGMPDYGGDDMDY